MIKYKKIGGVRKWHIKFPMIALLAVLARRYVRTRQFPRATANTKLILILAFLAVLALISAPLKQFQSNFQNSGGTMYIVPPFSLYKGFTKPKIRVGAPPKGE